MDIFGMKLVAKRKIDHCNNIDEDELNLIFPGVGVLI